MPEQLKQQPIPLKDDSQHYQEMSHVFMCMECQLNLQIDVALHSRDTSMEIDEGIMRIRLDPRIKLIREGYPSLPAYDGSSNG